MVSRKWSVLVGAAAVALVLAAAAQTFADNRVQLQAQLQPTAADPNASGQAEFESDSYRTELKVRVQNSIPNDVVLVRINGTSVGQIQLDNYVNGELDLDARRGTTVPTVKAGDVITIVDAKTQTLLLQGTFAAGGRWW
jgi:hypothetical protein